MGNAIKTLMDLEPRKDTFAGLELVAIRNGWEISWGMPWEDNSPPTVKERFAYQGDYCVHICFRTKPYSKRVNWKFEGTIFKRTNEDNSQWLSPCDIMDAFGFRIDTDVAIWLLENPTRVDEKFTQWIES